MPDFLFAATDSSGNTVRSQTSAADMTAAVAKVSALGLTLVHIELAAPAPAQPPQPLAPHAQPPEQTVSMQPQPQPPAQTVSMQPQPPPADLLKADAAKRTKLESELTAMGMSPDEIRRLVNANAATFEATAGDTGGLPLTAGPGIPPTGAKANRVTAASLESFAAELVSANAAKTKAAVREVNLALPEFREASTAELIQAERLLRDASMMRRKEQYRQAEAKAREAIACTPKDAAALELLGDILQGTGRVDEALAAYKRATQADARRTSAERKYGDLLMRQQNWDFADPEAVAPNRWMSTILSLCPGMGQLFNGDVAKAIVFFALDAVCIYLLFKSPWAVTQPVHRASGITLGSLALAIALYIAAIFDSNISAARKRTS